MLILYALIPSFLLILKMFYTLINKIIIILFLAVVILPIIIFFFQNAYNKLVIIFKTFPPEWQNILQEKVPFYKNLSPPDKKLFEKNILIFLNDYEIKAVDFEANNTDKLLVASSGIIPVFYTKPWHYDNLETVHLYQDSFTMIIPGYDEPVYLNGLVGQGHYKNQMYLSKKALYQSFESQDNKNTGIHEFLHLIDMDDGVGDGLPKNLLPKKYHKDWLQLVWKKIAEIEDYNSDISEYAIDSPAEFFAETGVYFFENPKELKEKHPKLYHFFKKMFYTE